MAEPHRRPLDDASVARLAALARDAADGEVPDGVHAAGRDRLLGTLEARAALPPAPRPWRLLPAATLAAAALLLIVAWPRARLSYALDGAPAAEGYVQSGPSGATARFSEGTEIRFALRARGRIAALTNHGARVEIEAGRASFRVVHLPSAEWQADAGPFTITVTGTEFDVSWSGERLEVNLHVGAVTVRGPLAPGGLALHAGQTLVADVARGELTLRDAAAPAPEAPATSSVAAPPSTAAPPASTLPPRPPPAPTTGHLDVEPAPAPTARPEAPTWRARVAAGDFAGVLVEADARGLDASLSATSLSDLAALADAARYAGRSDLAQRALAAERARFAGSAEARSAAFLLGRIAETSQPAAAIGWYDQYLTESPGGSLAAEALGRKMVTVAKVSGRDAARPVAEDYLRRFPRGALAEAATELAGGR